MRLSDIRSMPTTCDLEKHPKIHESVLRAFHIVRKVRYYLSEEVPAKIILELIDEMEGASE